MGYRKFPENELDPQGYFYLWITLARTRDAIIRVRENELQQYGVSPGQAGLLRHIKTFQNGATPADISRLSFRKPNTISINLARMEKKGLIKKSKDPQRRNLVRVFLTEKGEKIYKHTTKRESIYKLLSCLSEEQREQLRSCLETLLEHARVALGMKLSLLSETSKRVTRHE